MKNEMDYIVFIRFNKLIIFGRRTKYLMMYLLCICEWGVLIFDKQIVYKINNINDHNSVYR